MMAKEEGSDVLCVDEVAQMLGLSRNSVYAAVGRGEIPARRVGRRVIFSKRAIQEWLAGAGV